MIAQLRAALDEARSGRGRAVLMRGEAGIGKTSVTRAFVDSIADEAHVLWGRCDDLVAARPLGPVWDMAIEEPSLQQWLDQDSRQRVFTEMHELLTRSLRPTVMVIDDLHWADEATFDLVKFLGRRVDRSHGLLIVTYRDDDLATDHPLRAALGDLPPASVERISLRPLSRDGVSALTGHGVDSERMWEVTGGNPFFVTELIRSEGDVPLSIRDSVSARILRLSGETRDLVELASVAPGRLDLRLAEQALGSVDLVLTEAEESGLLEMRENAVQFRHELARRAVEGGLAETRRRKLNMAVLEACEALGEDVSRCAHHAREARDVEAMVAILPQAARRASELRSHQEALSHLRALEPHLDRFDEEQLAEHYDLWAYEEYLSSSESARELSEKAVEIRRRLGDAGALGASLLAASRIAWVSADREAALAYAREAASVLEPVGGESLGMAFSTMSQLAMLANEDAQAIELGERALAQVGPGPSAVRAHALNNIGTAKTNTSYPEGVDELEESYRISHELGLLHEETRAIVNLAWGHIFSRELGSALPWLRLGEDLMRKAEMPAFESYVTAIGSIYHEMAGDWDEAEARARELLERRAALETSRAASSMVLAKLQVRRGDPGAEETMMRAWERALKADEIQRLSPAGSVIAEFAWLGGQIPDQLIGRLEDVLERCIESRAVWFGGELAFWLTLLGVTEEVPQGLAEPFRLAARGDWQEAAAFWESRKVPYEHAMALSLGDTGARLAALEIFDRLGAVPMASRMRSRLKGEGVKGIPRGPQRATRDNPLGLTPRQSDVLELMAANLTNAEIADRLFLSTRTVDHHVSAILTRTGADDRFEAVDIARRAGLIA